MGVVLGGAALAFGLTACEVEELDWDNRSYTVSHAACVSAPGDVSVAVQGGTGRTPDAVVLVLDKVFGDFTRDGVNDVAVVLQCIDARGGNASGAEVQVFTRDGRFLGRLLPPQLSPPDALLPNGFVLFPTSSIRNEVLGDVDNLVSDVTVFAAADARCCPSGIATIRWVWDGHAFKPVPA